VLGNAFAGIRGRGGLATALVFAAFVAACGPGPTESLGPSTSSTTESPSLSLSQEAQDAVRFRTAFGLSADLDLVAEVARDPTATSDYGVPLLPAEVSHVLRRQVAHETAGPLLDAYGERHQHEFAGWFQDDLQRGAFVTLFTGNLQDHVRGLWDMLLSRTPPIAVQVRPARYSLAELAALQARIEQDAPAWADRGISIVMIGPRISVNAVEITVLAPAEGAEQALAAEYGEDAIIVYVTDKPPQVA